MTLFGSLVLFCTLLVLALVPSLSVITVLTRTAVFGLNHGICVALGIVSGDVLFIMVALFGLSVLLETSGTWFYLFKYLGGGYLIWMGIEQCRANLTNVEGNVPRESSLFSSFLAGLYLTLADQKAIFFYLGLFPAFVDLTELSSIDIGIIITIAVIAVGGAKLFYAWIAGKMTMKFELRAYHKIHYYAGVLIVLVGLIVILRA